MKEGSLTATTDRKLFEHMTATFKECMQTPDFGDVKLKFETTLKTFLYFKEVPVHVL